MILLDTNVISEPLRREPDDRVIAWIDDQILETLYLSAITVAELRAGVALLPAGKRRDTLRESLEKQVLPLFTGRVVPFDLSCTSSYAALMTRTRSTGRAIGMADACIAATADSHHFTVATRDVSPFLAAGIPVINPWEMRL